MVKPQNSLELLKLVKTENLLVKLIEQLNKDFQLSGVSNNQDNFAINIKLKEGKENFWFGNVTAAGGTAPDEELYLFQPKLFYYSPKFTVNVIGDLNNTGDVALTSRDIRNLGGGFRVPSRSSGTNINLGNNSLGFLTNQNTALEIENKLSI